jgi:transposase
MARRPETRLHEGSDDQTQQEEDARRPSREREILVGERTRIINRMKAALVRLGICGFKPGLLTAPQKLDALRTPFATIAAGPKRAKVLVSTPRQGLAERASVRAPGTPPLYLQEESRDATRRALKRIRSVVPIHGNHPLKIGLSRYFRGRD